MKDDWIVQLTKKEQSFLSTLVGILQKLSEPRGNNPINSRRKNTRRSFDEVEAMKKTVFAARKKNVPVGEIAEKLGVTTSYIYQLERK